MHLVVGLGNPGESYKKNRHNAGFMAVDFMSSRHNFCWSHKPSFKADVATGFIGNHKVLLCKPTTFMNLSGQAVSLVMSYYKIELKNLIVIHDDIDLKPGELRCKVGGSAGGHNGLKSIDSYMGQEYCRVRIGIGRPEHSSHDVSYYVLANFTNEELADFNDKYEFITQNIELLFSFQLEEFKNRIKTI